ncbi:YbgS-like family protein [Erwinia sp. S38]|uniref:YbgS-like family protein n=1 Tax=Erwinia sp. S38 TaxID=2769338 RepID=UPI001909A8A0|nr:YbgS-like family protein [Erwinia sp. S38]MBK0004341.1 YbgS-like family protein [Erwinia sp. S38]
MMNKFAIIFLTAAMSLGSATAMAADTSSNNGAANAAADAGAKAPDAKQNLQPNNVDNSKINTGDASATHQDMNAAEVHKNSQCKDGKCPDIGKKVGEDANHKTDGTTQ